MTLRGRKVRLDHAVRVAAYCGTMRDFQKLVVKRVMTAALADSVQHKREKVREKIKEKAADARASLNETRAAGVTNTSAFADALTKSNFPVWDVMDNGQVSLALPSLCALSASPSVCQPSSLV